MITWKDIKNKFDYPIVNEGEVKPIVSQRVTRTGLEFAGFFSHTDIKAIVLWGKEEFNYLEQYDNNIVTEKLERIFKLKPSLIVLSRSFKPFPILIELSKKYNVTIMATNSSSSEINTLINIFLAEALSEIVTLHGNLLEIYGKGVLIIGDSGVGKSETTTELIKKGHMFISDDAVDCRKVFHKLIGSPPKFSKGFMEVRGLGIINVERLFGIEKVKPNTEINIVIELVEFKRGIHNVERLGVDLQYKEILGIKLPYYLMPITSGKKISDLIEVIVANFKLIESGYISFKDFDEKSKSDN